MERREDALREALSANNEEIERWELYKTENEKAIENLKEFSKHLSIDVMVPVGRKAFMPGQLIHTNEVLVGHYQGYFSKCSSHTAEEICKLRLESAKDRLKKLETEAELWKNKLEKPYFEGAIPSGDEREIIEDYDEEQEKLWREEHKLKVKRAKLNEQKERLKKIEEESKSSTLEDQKSDEDIFKMLEEAELMEELENELEKLEIDEVNDETIRKLMSGEMELPKNKERTAHEPKLQNKPSDVSLNGVVKKTIAKESQEKPPATNNNSRVNPEIQIPNNSDLNSEEDDDEDLTEEARLIKEQSQFLPISDRAGFYEYQLEIIRTKIAKLRMTNEKDIDEKLHLFSVQAELEDLLGLAEEEIENTDSDNESNIDEPTEYESKKSTQKRRISFALENEIVIFRKSEAVSQMLPKDTTTESLSKSSSQRDVIKLDDNCDGDVLCNSSKDSKPNIIPDKKQIILDKVENNRKDIVGHQSKEDNCDLVTKIIEESTLTTPKIIGNTDEEFIPGKPSNFYEVYLKQQQANMMEQQPEKVYVNSYIGEEKVKVPILKEVNREEAFEDPRKKFSDPNCTKANGENVFSTKPILRNKSAVEREIHLTNPSSSKKQKKKKSFIDEDEYMSAYYKVMNDVIEKPLVEPDSLPQENFIDAHTPKKRVSRFKKMRSGIEKT